MYKTTYYNKNRGFEEWGAVGEILQLEKRDTKFSNVWSPEENLLAKWISKFENQEKCPLK